MIDLSNKIPLIAAELQEKRFKLSRKITVWKRLNVAFSMLTAVAGLVAIAFFLGIPMELFSDAVLSSYGWVEFVAIMIGCGGLTLWLLFSYQLTVLRPDLAKLQDSPQKECAAILKWLSDDDVKSYRDRVVAEGRLFTVGEVEDMRDVYVSNIDKKDRQRQESLDKEACRKLYLSL